MEIKLAYGTTGLDVHLDDGLNIDVIEPKFTGPVASSEETIKASVREPYDSIPLREWVQPHESVGIVFSDITRPVPNKLILPVILEELSAINDINITLYNALGTHRPNSEDEMREMIGDELVDKYRVVQNDALDPSTQRSFGATSRGNEVLINKDLAICDRMILTGFIEPHFFAGFSGGGKALMPGMAGMQTVLNNHGPQMIADPKATFGETIGNPIWEEIIEISRSFPNTFLVNVTLNKDKQVTGVFSGDLVAAHAAGCAFVKETAMAPVSHPYDIVITTNSGYPLDINLYQSVKGMSAAHKIVKKGGSIIIAAECRDGIPEHGCYGSLLRNAKSPGELLDQIMHAREITPDQWQAQIQAQIQLDADVYVYNGYLDHSQIASSLLLPCEDIEQTVTELLKKYGKGARICILPEGPQTIPFLTKPD